MMTKDGASEHLRIGVRQQMSELSKQLGVISIIEVERFGKTMLTILP